MKKRAIVSSIVTVSILVSAYGTAFADGGGCINMPDNAGYFEWFYDSYNHTFSLNKIGDNNQGSNPTDVRNISNEIEILNIQNTYNDEAYAFTGLVDGGPPCELESLTEINIYGSCSRFDCISDMPNLEVINIYDNDLETITINEPHYQQQYMPFPEINLYDSDVNVILIYENCYTDSNSLTIPAQYGSEQISYSISGVGTFSELTFEEGTLRIPDSAFTQCSGLTTVTIPDGVVSIGESAFGYCGQIDTAYIPSSVTSIDADAFASDAFHARGNIYFGGTRDEFVDAIEGDDHLHCSFEVTIHCTDGDIKFGQFLGWNEDETGRYYIKDNGNRVSGEIYYIGSDGYGFDDQGYLITDSEYTLPSPYSPSETCVYYFNEDGIMQTDYWHTDSVGSTHYFGPDGVAYESGLYTISGKKYFFQNGSMKRNTWGSGDAEGYYFMDNGEMAVSTTLTIDYVTYYFDENGIASTDPGPDAPDMTGYILGDHSSYRWSYYEDTHKIIVDKCSDDDISASTVTGISGIEDEIEIIELRNTYDDDPYIFPGFNYDNVCELPSLTEIDIYGDCTEFRRLGDMPFVETVNIYDNDQEKITFYTLSGHYNVFPEINLENSSCDVFVQFEDCTDYISGEHSIFDSLTIPAQYGIDDSISYSVCESDNITEVTFEDGTKVIPDEAFMQCSALATVTIPDGVESIGEYSFGGCTQLQAVYIPSSATGIDPNAFSGSFNENGNIYFDGTREAFIEAISGGGVLNCEVIVRCSDGDIKYSNAGSQYYMEYIGWGEDANGRYYIFEDGTQAWNNIYLIDGMSCGFDAQGYQIIDGELIINDYGTVHAYYFDENGEMLTNEWRTDPDGNTHYYGVDGIRYEDGLYTINSKKYFFVDGVMQKNTWGTGAAEGYYFMRNGEMAVSTTLTIDGVTYAFDYNGTPSTSGSVIWPAPGETPDRTGYVNSYNGTFEWGYYENSQKVIVDWSGSGSASDVTGFSDIAGDVITVVALNSSGSSQTYGFSGFGSYEMDSLTEVYIFGDCEAFGNLAWSPNLETVTICDNDLETITIFGMSNICEIVFPEICNYESSANVILSYVDCESASGDTLVVPAEYGMDESLSYAMTGIHNLKYLTFEDGTTIIPDNAFEDCDRLTTITIPNSVTTIGSNAFTNCNNLDVIYIRSSVTSIDCRAFYGSNLRYICYEGTCDQWCEIVNGNDGILMANCIINCTDGDILIRGDNDYYDQVYLGWNEDATGRYYILSSGIRARNTRYYVSEDSAYYGFDEDGYVILNGELVNNSNGTVTAYYFDGTGKMVTKYWWTDTNGDTHYYGSDGKRYESGLRTIDGIKYFFQDGILQKNTWGSGDAEGYYFMENGQMAVSTTLTIDGATYVFDENGIASADGWKTVEGSTYYIVNGSPVTGLQVIEEKTYLFDDSGVMLTGWQEVNRNDHYFLETGEMAVSVFASIDGSVYYFTDTGLPAECEWITVDGYKYYCDERGIVLTDLQAIDGDRYYFDGNGKMLTGWVNVGGTDYYFLESGAMAIDTFLKMDSSLCYFDLDGIMVKDGWVNRDEGIYYCNAEGNVVTGFQTINEKTYYFNDSGLMQTGWQKIDGKWHYFSASGVMATGWLTVDGVRYYFAADGSMGKGWVKINNDYYYFKSSGEMVTGWYKTSGKWYYFTTDGVMQTGWQKISNKWYYFDAEGAMATGWQKIGSSWYYFNSSGVMATGWQKISNKWYFFQSSGAMKTGWHKSGSSWYYLDSSGAMVSNCSKKIGSKTYEFDSNGVCLNP